MPPLEFPAPQTILTVSLQNEHDVVLARQRGAQVAALLGYGLQDQTRIATAVSEIARNAYGYASGGLVYFRLSPDSVFQIEIKDKGPGIGALDDILAGNYKSPHGMGRGIVGTKRLMDRFHVTSSPQGTTVLMEKHLPLKVVASEALLSRVTTGLTQQKPRTVLEEIQKQNQDMLVMMDELQKQQEQLQQLNLELEDTNRGVVALYAELDERAELLRKSNEIKSRFLSHISHELRTPLNAILNLSRLLLNRADGDLLPEQEKQVSFIRRSADSLADLVNDLLDLAKVEAGKLVIHSDDFTIEDLFSTLRGMLRPLLGDTQKVNLVFEEINDIPALHSDEGKVSQILRNLISNAIKFTPEGEVRVTAQLIEDDKVQFAVEDTGIGIAEKNLHYIFEEFGQIETSISRRTKGTGLGLPLARKLAQLLGGDITVTSQEGHGSRFCCTLSRTYQGSSEGKLLEVTDSASPVHQTGATHRTGTVPPLASSSQDSGLPSSKAPDSGLSGSDQGSTGFESQSRQQPRHTILIIDDDEAQRYLLKNRLAWTQARLQEATDGDSGLKIAQKHQPDLIFLDLVMPRMDGYAAAQALRHHETTRHIPVIIYTSRIVPPEEAERLRQYCDAILKKEDEISESGIEELRRTVAILLK
jgi:signal transduction histidine kinase/CheY-like chemotaxis protein